MSLAKSILNLVALTLKLRRKQPPRRSPADPRILVIRRNRMGDMIYTLALRRHHPRAHITVACDPPGEPIALACPAVNDVIALVPGRNPWQAVILNALHLQNYDWVIAVKGGFDRRLAVLTRLTNATVRVGFERHLDQPSVYFTDPVALPDKTTEEHQIETLLRLLKPLGLVKPTAHTVDLNLHLPDSALNFAAHVLAQPPFASAARYMLINLSSTVAIKFREEDFIALCRRLLASTDFAIGLVGAPLDQQRTHEIAMCMGSKRIIAVDTPGVLDLAALLAKAEFLFTPEGGAAHLAAAMGTPALVLWSQGPFEKWHSRGKKHAFIRAEMIEGNVPVEEVWEALQPFLIHKKQDVEKEWADLLELPPPTD
jgi:ADP-heptose:LPS heptosyltransferase